MIIKLILKIINFNLIYFFCKIYIKIKWKSKKVWITLNVKILNFINQNECVIKLKNINEIIYKII